MSRNLEKHQKYKQAYKPNDYYWGLGVEHETYLETSKLKQVTIKELKENRKQERYSVNYYTVYTPEQLDKALDGLFEDDEKILLPILVNSHTFIKTDINGEHKTTYERIPKPNPQFNGKTIHEWILYENPDYFKEEFEKSYLYDGDTFEFITQDFYKATVKDVIDELQKTEKTFMRALNSLPREGIFKTYAPFKLAQQNYPFASYLTNLKNNAMFNNGTLHINITLPTQLNDKSEIKDIALFTKQHQNYARVFQWISPLLIAKYGAYDPLCESETNGELYSAGSQRIAVSRYIGLGTYDTETMESGKILTREREYLKDIDWYSSFHTKTDYKFLDALGMDINFNKHFCHGLEFRIFESLPYTDLHDILELLVYLADFSLDKQVDNPKKSPLWHKIAENCVHNGKGYYMDVSDQNDLYELFGLLDYAKEPLTAPEVLDIIIEHIHDTYKDGLCVKCMILGEQMNTPTVAPLPTIHELPSAMSNSVSTSITEANVLQPNDNVNSLDTSANNLSTIIATTTTAATAPSCSVEFVQKEIKEVQVAPKPRLKCC